MYSGRPLAGSRMVSLGPSTWAVAVLTVTPFDALELPPEAVKPATAPPTARTAAATEVVTMARRCMTFLQWLVGFGLLADVGVGAVRIRGCRQGLGRLHGHRCW